MMLRVLALYALIFFGSEKVLHVAIGKKESQGYKSISLYIIHV